MTVTQTAANGLREGYRGHTQSWEGVIKQGSKVVWACGHRHHNRDIATTRHSSARSCAWLMLQLVTNSDYLPALRRWAPLNNDPKAHETLRIAEAYSEAADRVRSRLFPDRD